MNGVYRFAIGSILSSFIFFGCSKELSYETDAIPVTTSATGTLKDNSGNCMTITPNGTYFNGVPILGDTNYVQVTVNVQAIGNYNIQSDRQNGFQFAGSGVFTNTGIQTVNLKASGTPSQIQTTDFIVSFNNTSCGFSVNVMDSTGHGTGTTDTLNQWQFTTNGHTYAGNIQSALFTNLLGANLLMSGFTAASTDTAFVLSIQFPGASIATGTYATSDASTNFAFEKISAAKLIYTANATTTEIVNISVSSYSSSSKIISGTFSGKADFIDSVGNVIAVNITNGKFKAVVQ